jgi:hypothetical protein
METSIEHIAARPTNDRLSDAAAILRAAAEAKKCWACGCHGQ